ncbi:hypothetical protein WDU94_001258 [Cyamophila willieti]
MSKHFRRYQPAFVLCSDQCKKETKHLISLIGPERNMRQPSTKSIRSNSSSGNKSIPNSNSNSHSAAASSLIVKSAADPHHIQQVPKTNGFAANNGDSPYDVVKVSQQVNT